MREALCWEQPSGPWMMVTPSVTSVVTERAPVRVHPSSREELHGKGFEVIHGKGRWDHEVAVLEDALCQAPVNAGLGGVRGVFDDGLPVDLGPLDHRVAGDEAHEP